MTYKPHAAFVALYDAYTGPGSIAADLTSVHAKAAQGRPLLASIGSDLVLFTGNGASTSLKAFAVLRAGSRN
jgi:hypothetical protein